MVIKTVFVVLAVAVCVKAICDRRVVDDFQHLWKGNPPTNVLEWSVGTVTYVYITEALIDRYAAYKTVTCYQTTLNKDLVSTVDNYRTTTSKNQLTASYNMIMETPGVVTVRSPGTSDAYMYVLSLSADVIAYYQCVQDETRPSGVVISVKNYKQSDKKQTVQVEEALKLLKHLKLDQDLVPLATTACK